MKRSAIYTRVSTVEQEPEHQLMELRRYKQMSVSVKAGVLTQREFDSVDEVEQETIEEAVTNMLDRYGKAVVDREREVIRSNFAFFGGVWLEEFDDGLEGTDG